MDKRINNGGKREGAGRKPKADEFKLIEQLSEFDDLAKECMRKGIEKGNYMFWNKFMEYRYGKPKERLDITSDDESLNIPTITFYKTDED